MNRFLDAVWAMLTNNGMYSTGETIGIGIAALIATVLLLGYLFRKAASENIANMINDLGYDGYLQHKERMRQLGIRVD